MSKNIQLKKEEFDQITSRLKAVLNLQQNKEIADALELSYDAFNARRKRGSFPEEKLRILSAKNPTMDIDVEFVLTGALPHQRPTKLIMDTKAMTIKEVAATYTVNHPNEVVIDDPAELVESQKQAYDVLDKILSKIGFTKAHHLLRGNMANLILQKEITPYAAEILLILFRDEINYYDEMIEKMKGKK